MTTANFFYTSQKWCWKIVHMPDSFMRYAVVFWVVIFLIAKMLNHFINISNKTLKDWLLKYNQEQIKKLLTQCLNQFFLNLSSLFVQTIKKNIYFLGNGIYAAISFSVCHHFQAHRQHVTCFGTMKLKDRIIIASGGNNNHLVNYTFSALSYKSKMN